MLRNFNFAEINETSTPQIFSRGTLAMDDIQAADDPCSTLPYYADPSSGGTTPLPTTTPPTLPEGKSTCISWLKNLSSETTGLLKQIFYLIKQKTYEMLRD